MILGVSSGVHAALALEQLAASMAPGTWARLSVGGQDSVLGVGGVSGTMIHYCNAMPWNPVSNSFVLVSADLGWGTQTRHCYDHTTVNPHAGVVFHRVSNIGTGKLKVRYANSGSASFSAAPDIATGYDQIAIAATWWSGPFAGAGNQGRSSFTRAATPTAVQPMAIWSPGTR